MTPGGNRLDSRKNGTRKDGKSHASLVNHLNIKVGFCGLGIGGSDFCFLVILDNFNVKHYLK